MGTLFDQPESRGFHPRCRKQPRINQESGDLIGASAWVITCFSATLIPGVVRKLDTAAFARFY